MLTISVLIFIGIISAINYSIEKERDKGKKERIKNPNKKLYPPKAFKKGKTYENMENIK